MCPKLAKREINFENIFSGKIYGFECSMLIWGEKSGKLGSSMGLFTTHRIPRGRICFIMLRKSIFSGFPPFVFLCTTMRPHGNVSTQFLTINFRPTSRMHHRATGDVGLVRGREWESQPKAQTINAKQMRGKSHLNFPPFCLVLY